MFGHIPCNILSKFSIHRFLESGRKYWSETKRRWMRLGLKRMTAECSIFVDWDVSIIFLLATLNPFSARNKEHPFEGLHFFTLWFSCHAFMALQHGMAKGALPFTALQAARSILMSVETSHPFLAGKFCRLCLPYSVDVYHQIIFWVRWLSQYGFMPVVNNKRHQLTRMQSRKNTFVKQNLNSRTVL